MTRSRLPSATSVSLSPIIVLAVLMLSPAAWAASCREAAGAERAQELVLQCLKVSPATHPPCNAANPCDMISDEIQRGCLMLEAADGIPEYCGKYRRPN